MRTTRPFLGTDGEHLISRSAIGDDVMVTPIHPLLAKQRLEAFVEFFGEGSEIPIASSVMFGFQSIPWPILVPNAEGHRFSSPNLDPKHLWHPMFWLSMNYTHPLFLINEDDAGQENLTLVETEPEWIYRTFLDLEHSGLYDAETGEWVDVLATYLDIDANEPYDLERLTAWVNGGDDEQLDNFVLDTVVDAANEADPALDNDWAMTQSFQLARIHERTTLALQLDWALQFIADEGRLDDTDGVLDAQSLALLLVLLSDMVFQFDRNEVVLVEGEPTTLRDFLAMFDEVRTGGYSSTYGMEPGNVIQAFTLVFQGVIANIEEEMAGSEPEGEQAAIEQ